MRASPPNPPWLAADVRWAADVAPAAGAAHSARVSQLAVVTQPAPPTRVAPSRRARRAGGWAPRGRAARRRADEHRRCIEIRDWLQDFGVDRVTLLVIPAPRMHPFPARSPELAYWLLDRQDAGDAIAQHGLHHRHTRPGPLFARPVRRWQGGAAAEYAGLGRRPRRSRSWPGGACSRARACSARVRRSRLRVHRRAADRLGERFDWWATLLTLHAAPQRARPRCVSARPSPLKRAVSPL